METRIHKNPGSVMRRKKSRGAKYGKGIFREEHMKTNGWDLIEIERTEYYCS